jgi:hypothetical protein
MEHQRGRQSVDYATPHARPDREGWHPVLQVLFALLCLAAVAMVAWPLWVPWLLPGSK